MLDEMKWVPMCLRWLKINGRKPATVHAVKPEFEKTPKCFKEQIYAAAVAIPIILCSKVPHFMKQSLSNYRVIYTILRCNLKENG